MRSYFFFKQGEKSRDSFSYREAFQRSIKEKEQAEKWKFYYFNISMYNVFFLCIAGGLSPRLFYPLTIYPCAFSC